MESAHRYFRIGAPLILEWTHQSTGICIYRKRIPYKYEHPLYLKHFGIVYPDFTFLSKKTRQEIYWEHDGRMDDPIYAQNAVRKIQAYEENDIYPGERLILTFETERTALDMQQIEKLVCKYLTE